MATRVLELELTQGIEDLVTDPAYSTYRVLIRFKRMPLGWITLSRKNNATIPAEQVSEAVKQSLGWPLLFHTQLQRLRPQQPENFTEGISVIVCTRNRTQQLATCLAALLALDYPLFEVIVVDNAPSDTQTFELVAGMPVRYELEQRPGLDWARNRGIAAARFELIAFTDDDACPDFFWLQAVARALQPASVAAVTGLVVPTELETEAQHLFELGYGGMGHGFRRRIFSRSHLTERQLLRAGTTGIGVNMAFRRSILQQAGGFDPALDVGTPSRGGGDVELFHRLLALGHTWVYDPAMLVRHAHRREMIATEKQVKDNGCSFGCYLLTCYRNKSVRTTSLIRFVLIEWFRKWILRNLLTPPPRLPRRFALIELEGMLQSPFAYRAAQAQAKKMAAQQAAPPPEHAVPSLVRGHLI